MVIYFWKCAVCASVMAIMLLDGGQVWAGQQESAAYQTASRIVQAYLQAVQHGELEKARRYFAKTQAVQLHEQEKPCVRQVRELSVKYTTWTFGRVRMISRRQMVINVLFEEPRLDNLLKQIMQQQVNVTASSGEKQGAFDAMLCENIAHSVEATPRATVLALKKKKSTQCFTLRRNTDTGAWKIINQQAGFCAQSPVAAGISGDLDGKRD